MELFPAIDIKEGRVVRLTQGDYDKVTVYADNPADIAIQFRDAGAGNLHMVDLDGARDGILANRDAIERAVRESGLAVQVGGGIRDEARIAAYLDLGVRRVILGTVAVEDFGFVERMAARYGDYIAVGVDAREGLVAIKGWREVTDIDALDFCQQLESAGVATVIYTDIARDGMGTGTNLAVYRTLGERVNIQIIASGGISFVHEIETLRDMGVYGAILGKALYTGALRLEEVLKLC